MERYRLKNIIILILALMFQSCMQTKLPDPMLIVFMVMTGVNSLYAYLDGIGWLLDGHAEWRGLLMGVDTLYFLCPLALACLYWFLLCRVLHNTRLSRVATRCVVLITAAGALLTALNPIFGYYFTISEAGVYAHSPTFFSCYICPVVILAFAVVYILRGRMPWREKIVLLAYPILPYAVSSFSLLYSAPTYICAALLCPLFFLYTNLYVRKERELIRNQALLTETRMNSMLLQINPHFIYNTIGSAASLCTEDPAQARDMLYRFSSYLRNNFGEMANRAMIPFTEEVAHLNTYIEIEKMRFPDIEVKTEYLVTDFEVPSLSMQPLVENAIKHGILGREQGGTLTLRSNEDSKYYYVFVEDDGVGFVTMEKADGRNHIGVRNVKDRLKLLCGGELLIRSQVGVGTVAEIRIPKKNTEE